jgi:hypothetical protein
VSEVAEMSGKNNADHGQDFFLLGFGFNVLVFMYRLGVVVCLTLSVLIPLVSAQPHYTTDLTSAPVVSDATPGCVRGGQSKSCWTAIQDPSLTQISAGIDGTVYGLDAIWASG